MKKMAMIALAVLALAGCATAAPEWPKVYNARAANAGFICPDFPEIVQGKQIFTVTVDHAYAATPTIYNKLEQKISDTSPWFTVDWLYGTVWVNNIAANDRIRITIDKVR